jgi:hypothetical protein
MTKSVLYSVMLSPALVALPVGQMALASGAPKRHSIVAALGTAAPAGGNYVFLFNARLNARPEVAFDAVLSGPSHTGVFVGDGRTTSALALGGNPDPAAGDLGFAINPFITRKGDVVFDGNGAGIFTSSKGEIVPLVQDGDQAPGGGTLTPLAHAVNDRGAIAYLAQLRDSTATQGIFRTDGTGTVAIARDDIDAPTGGSFTSLFDPVINERGQVVFKAEMAGGTADFGIFRGDGWDLTPIFVANQIAPGGGTFMDFGSPALNARGQVAAVGLLTDSASSNGLFRGDGTNTVAIALEGQAAPKGGKYASRATFPGPLRLNDRGEAVFHARLEGGASSDGIFRGNGEGTATVALAGTIAPGTTGTFEQFFDIELGNDGRVAFIASLVVGEGGVDFSNNMGIWVGTAEGDLRLVVRTGEVIGGSVLTGLPIVVGGNSEFDMNENAVVWIGNFQSPARAIVLSRIIGKK